MGKRTSDFMALATIVAGAGLGLGLTNLFPQSGADAAPRAEDSSVRVRVLRRNIVVEPGRRLDASAWSNVVREALIVEPERLRFGFFGTPKMEGLDREQLERLRAQAEELRREKREMGDLKGRYEVLEWEAFKALELGENLTIDVLQLKDDERRKRRRRRPRRAVEGPQADPLGN
jgi:hypothetical protein